jgi:hypothetical protein
VLVSIPNVFTSLRNEDAVPVSNVLNFRAMRFFQLSLFAVIFAGGMSAIVAAQSPNDPPKVVIELNGGCDLRLGNRPVTTCCQRTIPGS